MCSFFEFLTELGEWWRQSNLWRGTHMCINIHIYMHGEMIYIYIYIYIYINITHINAHLWRNIWKVWHACVYTHAGIHETYITNACAGHVTQATWHKCMHMHMHRPPAQHAAGCLLVWKLHCRAVQEWDDMHTWVWSACAVCFCISEYVCVYYLCTYTHT